MYIEEIKNYKELKRVKKKNLNIAYKIVKDFLKMNVQCIRIVNDCDEFNNNSDVRRAIQAVIENLKYDLVVFMVNGSVYLRRKDGKD